MTSFIRKSLLAAFVVVLFAVESRACWYACGCFCYQPICWYPCWPCWPPDETPLDPMPTHPGHATNGTRLWLQNRTYSDAFVTIYLKYPDGIYRVYEKRYVNAGTTIRTKQQYYQGDQVLIQTWARGTPLDCWHCRCFSFVTLTGLFNMFDVIHCHLVHLEKEPATAAGASPATIVVNLPEDAKVSFDNCPTESTSATRVFTTPNLEEGKQYSYTVKAEVVRNGRVQTVTREVIVRAGEESKVTLEMPSSTVAGRQDP